LIQTKLKVGVAGLWHLGAIYSVCFAEIGHEVIAYDPDVEIIKGYQNLITPVYEPGLLDLLQKNLLNSTITFTNDKQKLDDLDFLILAFDTPVDEFDNADNMYVISQFETMAPFLSTNTKIIISSQLPVGSCNKIQQIIGEGPYSSRVLVHPENLRLGKAINSFFSATRIIIGTFDGKPDTLAEKLFNPFHIPIVWMHNKSAEMTKHALNAFLAASISFMGEIADLCEKTGADAKEVEIGLKSDPRIGHSAYLSPGLGFAGGTLARDVQTLSNIQMSEGTILKSIMSSNKINNDWITRLLQKYTTNTCSRICFWGVSYAENTNTLRRSEIYEVMKEMLKSSHFISYVENSEITEKYDSRIKHINDLEQSINDIDVLVVTKRLSKFESNSRVHKLLSDPKFIILDPARLLLDRLPDLSKNKNYFAVGRA